MVHRRVFAFSREDREDVGNFRGNGESLADILGESWMSVDDNETSASPP